MTVSKMTEKAWNYVGVKRNPSGDFSDDGNYFKSFINDDRTVEITYLTSDGSKYLSVRGQYEGLMPYEFWSNHAESEKVADKYNGYYGEIDLDDLKSIIEAVHDDIINVGNLYKDYINTNKMGLREARIKEATSLIKRRNDLINRFKEVDWFDFDFNKVKYDDNAINNINLLKTYYSSLQSDIKRAVGVINTLSMTNIQNWSSRDLDTKIIDNSDYYANKIENTIKLAVA